MSKTDSTGTFSFKRNGAGVTDAVLSDGAATYTPGISERRGGSSKFLHSGMKNADAQSGASANVDSSRTYDAFGNLTGSVGTWSGPFGYAGGFGYQEDPDHGLRLLGHRYYDSSTGRFISKDPIGDGRNWTAYCDGNPASYADPLGLEKLRLPKTPAGLPEGWTRLSRGGGRGEEYPRFLAPGGREGLEYHKGVPGAPGEQGEDHWHRLKRNKKGKLEKQDDHLKPGDVIEVDTDPIVDAPTAEGMWQHVDWGEAAKRTAIVVVIGGIVLITIGSGGAAGAAGAGVLIRLRPVIVGGM